MNINERIKSLRKTLALSQVDFGEKIGLKQGAISKMEQIGNTIIDQNIKIICEKFYVNEAWLRNGNGEIFLNDAPARITRLAKELGMNEDETNLLKIFMGFSPTDRQQIIKFAQEFANKLDRANKIAQINNETFDIEAEVKAYREELLAKKKDALASEIGYDTIKENDEKSKKRA